MIFGGIKYIFYTVNPRNTTELFKVVMSPFSYIIFFRFKIVVLSKVANVLIIKLCCEEQLEIVKICSILHEFVDLYTKWSFATENFILLQYVSLKLKLCFLSYDQRQIQSNMCTTTSLTTQNVCPLLTCCRCSEVASCYKDLN